MTPQECAAMGEMMGGMMGQMMSGGMMGAGWTWFGLLTLAVIIAVGVAVAFVVRRPTGPVTEDPRDILRRRFARGELTADEFSTAMKTLQ